MESESGSNNPLINMHHHDMDLPLPSACSTELTNELKDKVDVLLVTVTAIEWSAVMRKMKPVPEANRIFKVHHDKETYIVGTFGLYCVALIQSEKGPQAAQSVVSSALNCWNTKATILVGTCLGLKEDHQLGDVIVSKPLATYDREKKVSSNQSHNQGLVIEGGQNLSPLFTKEADTFDWKFGDSIKRSGLMLSGSVDVESAEFANELKTRYPEAIGIETEGDGVHTACRDNFQQWIVIKGIYGFPGSTSQNIEQVMKYASAAATSLVLHVLSEESLKPIGCIAIGAGDVIPQKTWTPNDRPVFVSFDQAYYNVEFGDKIIDGLLEKLKACQLNVHVSNSTNTSNSFSTAKPGRAVFLALVDHEFYLRSRSCMWELKNALESDGVDTLVILLSSISQYTCSNDVSELLGSTWQSKWVGEWKSDVAYLNVVHTLLSLAKKQQRRVHEDPSFGFNTLAQDSATLLGQENVNVMAHQLQKPTPSLWRILHPIRKCNPSRISDTTVEIHQHDYQKIVQALTSNDNTSVSIAGLKAAGGVGKTVLARRIANCQAVQDHFASEGVLWAEFGEEDTTAQPALRRIYLDLGGEEELSFHEDASGELAKARECFEELLAVRQPKVLLVMDDVWDEKYLKVFQDVITNTEVKLLVTTRFKGVVEEVFGRENSVVDLNTFLSENDAFTMMRKYAGISSTNEEDVAAMTKLADHLGYHAKALAIVSARLTDFGTWDNLLSSVQNSKISLNGATKAKQWVYSAVTHTLAFALNDASDLNECFLQLGVLIEGERVSINDLCLVWNCETFEATAIANVLFKCSVLEADEVPEYEGHAVYYMHDLVRDCARLDVAATKEREARFVGELCYVFNEEPHRATEYVFQHLLKHLPAHDALWKDIRKVYSQAMYCEFENKWSNTEFIVLNAVGKVPGPSLAKCGAELWKKKGFFERVMIATGGVLFLNRVQWTKDSDALSMFINALKSTRRLRKVCFNRCPDGPAEFIAILDGLKENQFCGLEYLEWNSWDRNYMGSAGASCLAKCLEIHNKTLTEFRVISGGVSGEGAKAIAKAMGVNKSLVVLKVDCVNLCEHRSVTNHPIVTCNMCTAIDDISVYFRLRDNLICDDTAVTLGNVLKLNSSLVRLELEGNHVEDKGATSLGNGLKSNTTLEYLNLSDNIIGDHGAEAIGDALKVNSTLGYLCLNTNIIGVKGAVAIGNALKETRNLWFLNLARNPIGDIGAIALANGLAVNSSLQGLFLNDSYLSDKCALTFGKAVKVNSTLLTLDLRNNILDDEGAVAFVNALQDNSTLRDLYLRGNSKIGRVERAALRFLGASIERDFGASPRELPRNKNGEVDWASENDENFIFTGKVYRFVRN